MPRSGNTASGCFAMTLGFFPSYQCVWLYRADLKSRSPAALAALTRLEGRISSAEMAAMNARAKLDRVPEERVAADFLAQKYRNRGSGHVRHIHAVDVLRRLGEHVTLVAISLFGGDRRGDSARRHRGAAATARTRHPDDDRADPDDPIAGTSGVHDSLAGDRGQASTGRAFLYSLLPIVRNTATGLRDIPVSLRESAEALGLPAARGCSASSCRWPPARFSRGSRRPP